MRGSGALCKELPQPLGHCCAPPPPPSDGVVDNVEYPSLPSQEQDSASQDSLAVAEAAPLAAALMVTSPPITTEGQGEDAEVSGALLSGEEREASEQVVDGDGYLVERAAGPHIVKEIIIYDVYDNDDNIVADNYVDPTTANKSKDPNTSVGVDDNDSENCLEDFNVAEHVGALNQGAENVETYVKPEKKKKRRGHGFESR